MGGKAKAAGISGAKRAEEAQRKREEQLFRLSECFLSFGDDPDKNITEVVALCGELLGGCCALYNRLGEGVLHTAGMWNTPPDYSPKDNPEGHICYDVIRQGTGQPLVVRNLPETPYAKTDPNVAAYGLRTYVGHPVKCDGAFIGSLCVVYQEDFEPGDEHLMLLRILASAIGVEERRRNAAKELRGSEQRLDAMLRSIGDHMSMLDRDLNIVWANDVAKSMFGQDIVGRKCHEVYHRRTEPCEPHPCLTLRAFEDGKVHEHGVQVIDKDGHARYFHCTANVALRDAEGKPATVLELSRDITAIKQAEIQLLAYQQQLRALTAQVSSAEERERRRLATELHDHIGQALAVAKIKLGRARREAGNSPVSGLLGEVHGLIDRMIQDTRSLAFQLSPPLLHELGFVEAVEWLVEQFRTEHGLSIEVKGEGGSLPLDGDLAGMLFRGVRELLMNVVKHARAKKTQVIIGRDGPHMRVEVRDDGDGFDTSGHPTIGGGSGFGLFSLRERLSYLGGRLEVESARGRGTRVVMVVPAGEGKPAEGAR